MRIEMAPKNWRKDYSVLCQTKWDTGLKKGSVPSPAYLYKIKVKHLAKS